MVPVMNKAETLKALQQKLGTDLRWAHRGLQAIFKNQTDDEQDGANVKYHNTMGFRCVDAHILTSFCNQLQRRGFLSEKQNAILLKKMPRYGRQLMKFYGEAICKSLATQ